MKIEKLEIKTENVEEQLKFYRDTLELEVKNYNYWSFEVKIGYSTLKFVESEKSTSYHIAIHIPDRQEGKALEWIKERVSVLKNNGDDLIDFSGWNAMSLYFYDADNNIMEFIARRNCFPPHLEMFSKESLLGIAEIGLATNNILEKYKYLHKKCHLEKFDGDFEKFCAIGDDEGLLITIDKNKKDWFPTKDEAHSSDFKVSFTHAGNQYQLQFEHDQLFEIKQSY